MPLPKLNNLLVCETCSRFCAIDSQMSFLALVITSKKIQNHSHKVVTIWRSQWNSGFSIQLKYTFFCKIFVNFLCLYPHCLLTSFFQLQVAWTKRNHRLRQRRANLKRKLWFGFENFLLQKIGKKQNCAQLFVCLFLFKYDQSDQMARLLVQYLAL